MEKTISYKKCPTCGCIWCAPEELVLDQSLKLNGYQAAVPDAEEGLLLFTHEVNDCQSTMAVLAMDFRFMHKGTSYSECRFQQPECEGRCLDESDLDRCQAHCCMAWVRDVIQYIRNHEVPQDQVHVHKTTEALCPTCSEPTSTEKK